MKVLARKDTSNSYDMTRSRGCTFPLKMLSDVPYSVNLFDPLKVANSDVNPPDGPELPAPDQAADAHQDFVPNRQFLTLRFVRHHPGDAVEQRHGAHWPIPELAENVRICVRICEHIFQRKSAACSVSFHGFDH